MLLDQNYAVVQYAFLLQYNKATNAYLIKNNIEIENITNLPIH